jgi:hypothetical protein
MATKTMGSWSRKASITGGRAVTDPTNRLIRPRLAALALAVLLVPQPSIVTAEELPLLLVVDRTTVSENRPAGATDAGLNRAIADVGLRDLLPHFQARVGEHVVLTVHEGDDNGWFAFGEDPDAWDSAPESADGLVNFFLAGPGLGSPGDDGLRESLLGGVGSVIAVRDSMLPLLQGRTACAVVYDGEILADAAGFTNLTGKTLGIFGFRVLSPQPTGAVAAAEVEVVDASVECRASLTALDGAN